MIGTGASAVQFVPEIAEQAGAADRLPAHGQLVPAAQQPPATRAALQGGSSSTSPGVQALPPAVHVRVRRVADADDPPPAHGRARLGALRSQPVHALAARGDPRAAPQGLAGLHVRLQADPVQLALPARAAAPERRARDRARSRADARAASSPPTAREHEVDCIIYGTGFRTQRLHVPDGDHRRRRPRAARRLGRRRARAPRA